MTFGKRKLILAKWSHDFFFIWQKLRVTSWDNESSPCLEAPWISGLSLSQSSPPVSCILWTRTPFAWNPHHLSHHQNQKWTISMNSQPAMTFWGFLVWPRLQPPNQHPDCRHQHHKISEYPNPFAGCQMLLWHRVQVTFPLVSVSWLVGGEHEVGCKLGKAGTYPSFFSSSAASPM